MLLLVKGVVIMNFFSFCRRKYQRVKLQLRVHCSVNINLKEYDGEVVDISALGIQIFLKTNQVIAEKELVTIFFKDSILFGTIIYVNKTNIGICFKKPLIASELKKFTRND